MLEGGTSYPPPGSASGRPVLIIGIQFANLHEYKISNTPISRQSYLLSIAGAQIAGVVCLKHTHTA